MFAAVLERFSTLKRTHRIWFVLVFCFYPLYLVLLPPLQGADNPSFWQRSWSVASGQITCGRIPAVAEQFVAKLDYAPVRARTQPFFFTSIDQARALRGSSSTVSASGTACVLPPLGFLSSGLVLARMGNPYDPRASAGVVGAYYGARMAHWLLLSLTIAVGLLYLPFFRSTLLAFYSWTFTVEQTASLAPFCTSAVLLLGLLMLSQSSAKRLQWVGFAVLCALVATDLSFIALLPCVLLHWFRGPSMRTAKWWAIGLCGLAVTWLVALLRAGDSAWLPTWGVEPARQLLHLVHSPTAWWAIAFRGWAQLFASLRKYEVWGVLSLVPLSISWSTLALIVLGTFLAVCADLTEGVASPSATWSVRVWTLSALAVLVAMAGERYLFYTPVGFSTVLGLHVRMLLVPVLILLFALRVRASSGVRARPAFALLARASACLCCCLALRDLVAITLEQLIA